MSGRYDLDVGWITVNKTATFCIDFAVRDTSPMLRHIIAVAVAFSVFLPAQGTGPFSFENDVDTLTRAMRLSCWLSLWSKRIWLDLRAKKCATSHLRIIIFLKFSSVNGAVSNNCIFH